VRAVEAACPQEAQRLLEAGLELPVVVKPTGLDGSRGVRLIEHASDVRAWAGELGAYGYRGPVLVEEYLRGPEFSVETVTTESRHHVVGITAKRLGPPPGFVEMGHVYPAPLPEADRAAIAELVVAFLDAAGYRFGPTHTEVILTAQGPRIVESQARLGGDRIPQLIEVASGFDIEAALFRALAGGPVDPGRAQRLGCISFFDLGTGRLRSVGGVDAIERLPFVHALKLKVRPGDVLRPVTDSQSRHGYVVIDAAAEEQAGERFGVVRALLQVVTHPEAED
jgi:biotin carboxylase